MKTCKTCRHHEKTYSTNYCYRKGREAPNPVTGVREQIELNCIQERKADTVGYRGEICGIDAKFWEEKLTWGRAIKIDFSNILKRMNIHVDDN